MKRSHLILKDDALDIHKKKKNWWFFYNAFHFQNKVRPVSVNQIKDKHLGDFYHTHNMHLKGQHLFCEIRFLLSRSGINVI